MAIEVFNRYENKYLLSLWELERVEAVVQYRMALDAYNQGQSTYSITNLYYDTPTNGLIRASLQKPKYKEKLRLRAYGVPQGPQQQIYVEIKKKFAGLVNKRRSSLGLQEAYGFLETGYLPQEESGQNRQVLREIQYLQQQNPVQPALYLAYDRRAYFGVEDGDLRISFDFNIRTRRRQLRLEDGDYGAPLLEPDQCLMEVKTGGAMPLWLCRTLSEQGVFPTSFSKYGAEYKKTLAQSQPQPWRHSAPFPDPLLQTGSAEIIRRSYHV